MKTYIIPILWFVALAVRGLETSNLWPQCEQDESCANEFPYCPDCSLVDCLPHFGPADCPKGSEFVENVLWGCCPACVRYLKAGKTWSISFSSTQFTLNLFCP